MLRAQHFHHYVAPHGSVVFGDIMREYERRVVEATMSSSAKATTTTRVQASLARLGRGRGRRCNGQGCECELSDGVGRLSPEVLTRCKVTFGDSSLHYISWHLYGRIGGPCPALNPLSYILVLDPSQYGTH